MASAQAGKQVHLTCCGACSVSPAKARLMLYSWSCVVVGLVALSPAIWLWRHICWPLSSGWMGHKADGIHGFLRGSDAFQGLMLMTITASLATADAGFCLSTSPLHHSICRHPTWKEQLLVMTCNSWPSFPWFYMHLTSYAGA